MRTPSEIREDLPPDLDPAEAEQMVALALRLEAEAPTPYPPFRAELRVQLVGTSNRRATRESPRATPAFAAAYALTGALLLAVAAIGLAGTGPFAAS